MPVVFERVELDYGLHGGVFEFIPPGPIDPSFGVPPSGSGNGGGNGTSGSGNGTNGSDNRGSPFVVLGHNGAGKSTLIEAPVRALFGFKRNRKAGREAHGRRRPWAGGPYRALVSVRTDTGRYTFERDFETDRIKVTEEGRQSPMFDAEANPSRTGESVRQYRQILRDVIGLDSFDHYRDTACVFQGGLLATGLSVELLRVAAGGHTDVESAHASLRDEYGSITVEPIAPGVARRRKPGRLETLNERVEDLELRATEARDAEERRTPLVRAREDCVVRLEALALETARLEAAFETLSEGQRLETETEAVRARIRSLESAEHELDETLAGFGLLVAREQAHKPRYPVDFAERARALEEGLWPRLDRLEEEADRLSDSDRNLAASNRGLAGRAGRFTVGGGLLGGGLAVAGIAIALSGSVLIGLPILTLGLAAGVIAYTRHRATQLRAAFREARLGELAGERSELVKAIRRLTADVPDGASLRAETLAAARREFEREEADRRLHADSEQALRQAVDAAGRALALHRLGRHEREGSSDADAVDLEAEAGADAHRDTVGLADRARGWLRALREASATERDDEMAPLRLRLNEIARARFDLPGDVEPDLEAVRLARRQRLARAGEAQAELSSLERQLAAEGRVTDSVLSLERELDECRAEATTVEARARAFRQAYSFVADAYEAFRTTDEERLLDAISDHLHAVSGGAMGPIEAASGLDESTVRAADRSLPLTSPPLSYGQLHAALLSVRMGAADFLAGLGVGLPLLIDDPFVHLDERAVSDLWEVLQRIASTRQVIVATQDRLVLEYLGVTPDLVLSPAGPLADREHDLSVESDALTRIDTIHDPEAPRIGEVLDLWDESGD